MPSKKKGDLNQVEIHIDFVLLQVIILLVLQPHSRKMKGKNLKERSHKRLNMIAALKMNNKSLAAALGKYIVQAQYIASKYIHIHFVVTVM